MRNPQTYWLCSLFWLESFGSVSPLSTIFRAPVFSETALTNPLYTTRLLHCTRVANICNSSKCWPQTILFLEQTINQQSRITENWMEQHYLVASSILDSCLHSLKGNDEIIKNTFAYDQWHKFAKFISLVWNYFNPNSESNGFAYRNE